MVSLLLDLPVSLCSMARWPTAALRRSELFMQKDDEESVAMERLIETRDAFGSHLTREVVGPRVVGLTGLAGSGKSTVAALLRMRGFHELGFADALRAEVDEAVVDNQPPPMPVGVRFCWNKLKFGEVYQKPTSYAARKVLQWWGTEYRRSLDENYWVKRLEPLASITLISTPVVISDVRFPNEAACIWRLGGQVWKIQRSEISVTVPKHSSETTLIPIDKMLLNDGLIGDLADNILELLG